MASVVLTAIGALTLSVSALHSLHTPVASSTGLVPVANTDSLPEVFNAQCCINTERKIPVPAGTLTKTMPALSVVPFSVRNQHIYVTGEVNGQSGYFVLDTGTPYVTLNSSVVNDPGPVVDSSVTSDTRGVKVPLHVHRVQSLTWGGVSLRDVGAIVLDVSRLSSLVPDDKPFLGLISSSQMWPFAAVFNYGTSELQLYALDRQGRPKQELPTPKGTVPIKIIDQLVCAPIVVGDKTIYMELDTGGGLTSLDEHVAELLGTHISKTGETTSYAGLSGQPATASMGAIDHFTMGGVPYESLNIMLREVPRATASDLAKRAGIMGHEFFEAHTIGFNLRQKKIYIWD